jgi:hypothetical protein
LESRLLSDWVQTAKLGADEPRDWALLKPAMQFARLIMSSSEILIPN